MSATEGGPVSAQPFVFSIRPTFVERILDGSKRWEFRTRKPAIVAHEMILVYETAPRSMIVATARVANVIVDSPSRIWLSTLVRGVTAAEFNAYFDGRDRAVALHLYDVTRLSEPRHLPPGMAPPQSWSRYKGVWA